MAIEPVLKFGLAALLLAVVPFGKAQAVQGGAAVSDAAILQCGLSAFSEADDRLIGQVYVASRHSPPRNGPDGRRQISEREEEQIADCGRQYRLNAKELDLLDKYTMGEMLRRGASWDLRHAGFDPAKLHPIARLLSAEDYTHRSNDILIRRLRPDLEEAGVPRLLYAAAVDYIVFACRANAARWLWAQQRAARR